MSCAHLYLLGSVAHTEAAGQPPRLCEPLQGDGVEPCGSEGLMRAVVVLLWLCGLLLHSF